MINYCQSAQCRTRYILDYFGEDVGPEWQCGNCDACDGPVVGRRAVGIVAERWTGPEDAPLTVER